MKRISISYRWSAFMLSFMLLTGVIRCLASDDQTDRKKTYSKSYDLGPNDRVSVNNQFGQVRVETWNEHKVQVDVEISVSANSDEYSQRILDGINIKDGKNGNEVYFKTDIGAGTNNYGGRHGKTNNMQINYLVHVPASNPLRVTNQFGEITMPDYTGEVSVDSKFGSLVAGNLNNVKMINLQFGFARIEGVVGGKYDFQFATKEIAIKKVAGSVDIRVQHCKSQSLRLTIDKSINDLVVKSSFSNVSLSIPSEIMADFDIHTSFGNFASKASFSIKEKRDSDDDWRKGPRFDHQYMGGDNNSNVKIKIRGEFSDINII